MASETWNSSHHLLLRYTRGRLTSKTVAQTFGQLIADVATWAATRSLRRENLKFGEQLGDTKPEFADRMRRVRKHFAEADAQLEAAVAALDVSIGVTLSQLAQIGVELDKIRAFSQSR